MQLDRALHVVRRRVFSLLRRGAAEAQLAEEIAYHLDEETEARVARGEDREAARREVLRAFGGVERRKEECRDARGTVFVESVVKDLRHAAIALLRQPAYTGPAVVTLALGIGITIAVFALVQGILLAPLPYPDASRLVGANAAYPAGAIDAARREIRTMDVAAYTDGQVFTLASPGALPIRVNGSRVSAELFRVLGAMPALGRVFRPGEDTASRDRVAILSDALWTSRFARDRGIVGRTVDIDGTAREVVGVMPPAFDLPSRATQVWVPLALDPRDVQGYWARDFMPLIARLRPGVTAAEAQADLRVFQAGIRGRFPWKMPDDWNRDLVVVPLKDALVGSARGRLLILAFAVLAVLAIACANVANLSLSRAATREREIGIRTAIGGAPRRIARQLLTEHLLLSSIGAAGGFALAWPLLTVVTRVLPAETPRLASVTLDWRAQLFTALVAVVTGCAFGLAPVVHTLRLQLRSALDAGGRSGGGAATGPVRRLLAIAQIGCAALLVIAAGLLVRSLWTLSHVDPGFRTTGVATARFSADASRCGEPARCVAFYRELEDRLRAIPGVRDAAFVNVLPLTGTLAKRSLAIDGYTVPAGKVLPLFRLNVVTPGYTGVMGLRLVAGRGFTDRDRAGEAVAIVSAASARRFWPGRDPIGRQFHFVGESRPRTVVGIAADVRAQDLTRDEPEWIDGTIYVPFSLDATLQDGGVPAELIAVLRTDAAATALEPHLRRIAAEAGGVVIDELRPIAQVVGGASATPAATASLLAATAALALILGSVGVYSVLSFLIARRTHELGIRVAMGALPRDLCWLVVREGAMLCAAGLLGGVAGAMLLMRGLAAELHGVSPMDPLTYAAVVVTIALVTLLACLVPTRRAMRVNPLIVLRAP